MEWRLALKILLVGLVGGVVVCGVLGVYFYRSTARFVETAVRAEAIVVANERAESSDGDMFYSVAEFTGLDGTVCRARTTWMSCPPTYEIGEKVHVLYDPSNPLDARFGGLWLWGASLICGGLALFDLLAIAVLIVILTHRRRTEPVTDN